MRRRGFGLLAVMGYAGLALIMVLATLSMLEAVRGHVSRHKLQQQAACMAASGRNYAVAMLHSGTWHAPVRYSSPLLPGGGRFDVSVPAWGPVQVVGWAGAERCPLQVNR